MLVKTNFFFSPQNYLKTLNFCISLEVNYFFVKTMSNQR